MKHECAFILILLASLLVASCDSQEEGGKLVVSTDSEQYSVGSSITVRVSNSRSPFRYHCIVVDGILRDPAIFVYVLKSGPTQALSSLTSNDIVWDNQASTSSTCLLGPGEQYEVVVPESESAESGPGFYVAYLHVSPEAIAETPELFLESWSQVFEINE